MKIEWSFQSKVKDFYESIIIGTSREFNFGQRLVMLTNLIMALFGLMSIITNYLLGFGTTMIGLMAGTTVIFFCYYIIGRHWGYNNWHYLLISVTYLVIINLGWTYDYGSKGPVLAMFIILYAFFIFIWENRMLWFASVILFLNIFILFWLEWKNPGVTGDYPDDYLRLSDVYLELCFSLLLIMGLSVSVKLNYVKESRHARKADQLKSAFLANMSHEIRTPLNAIVGFSSLVSDDSFDQDQKEEFKNLIAENSNYLMALIEDIIDLSKIEVDALQLQIKEVDVEELFEKLRMSFLKTLSIEPKDLAIRYKLPENMPVVTTDAIRLEQVLRNLISNAIKFTSKGYVEFGIKLVNEIITFYVKDTGIGIKPENQQKIFERFVKIEDCQKNYYRGTGIGLFLCEQLITKLNGRIWVESGYGQGATFYFTVNEFGY